MWYHLWLLGGVSSIESEFYSGLRLLLCGMLFRGYFFYFYLRMSFFCCNFAPQNQIAGLDSVKKQGHINKHYYYFAFTEA